MVNDELTSAHPLSPQTLPSQPRFARTQSLLSTPSHIALPPAPDLSSPYHTAPSSPALPFYTAPTSPLIEPFFSQPQPQSSPPSLHITIPPTTLPDEPFPAVDYTIQPVIEDEGLSPLEKIYLYARSKATFHKLFIIRTLPEFLSNISSQEAIEYVLPLLSGLAVEDDEQVKETLATELVPIVWWFLTNCTISDNASAIDAVPVQSFTLILGTLLLNSSPTVADTTRRAVVELLTRLKKADDREGGEEIVSESDSDDEQYEAEWVIGSFKRQERDMFRNEVVQQVIIGMGRLDVDADYALKKDEEDVQVDENAEPIVMITSGSSSSSPHLEGQSVTASMSEILTSSAAGDYGRDDSQAMEGRISSMSLIAAVSASGALNSDMNEMFVKDVVRVGADEVYWVRSETSYALGALAKVVPEEVVISSLLPLFEKLRRDAVWQVRQSSAFAHPAILSRLRGRERRRLALETIEMLWVDKMAGVRQALLETLGEVIYTFCGEEDGPPKELVEIFLGRREGEGVFEDGDRALVCGFNYPAVAAAMGREGWKELREVYGELGRHEEVRVRRTLAASVGVIGEIIGEEAAEMDLVWVWWDGIGSEWEEVRVCAAESAERLLGVVCDETGEKMIGEVVQGWDSGRFSGWRERERIVRKLGRRTAEIVKRGLLDPVVAVRRAALVSLAAVPDDFLFSLKSSTQYHQRITFIECCQALGDSHLDHVVDLVDDPVVDVRIALARLARAFNHPTISAQLAHDSSHQVRSFVISHHHSHYSHKFNVFSRPPP